MRLSARMKVDLPQPLGPMMAVTLRAAILIVTSWSACRCPYHMLKFLMSNAISSASTGWLPAGGPAGVAETRIASAAAEAEAVSGSVDMAVKRRFGGRATIRGP